MIKKLRFRFAAVLTTVLTVFMIIVCTVIYINVYTTVQDNIERSLTAAMDGRLDRRDAGAPFRPPEPPKERDGGSDAHIAKSSRVDERVPFYKGGGGFGMGWMKFRLDADGNITEIIRSHLWDDDGGDEFEALADEAVTKILAYGKERGYIEVEGTYYRYGLDRAAGTVVLLDIQNELGVRNRLAMTLIIVFLLSVTVFVLLSAWLSRRVTRPVEDAWNRQTVFFSNASHELKTPLAVISANLDAAVASPEKTVAEQSRWLDVIRDETGKMSGLINEMLYLSREEYAENTVTEDVDLSTETERACLAAEALVFESGRTLVTDIAGGVTVNGDKSALTRVIHILIENAVRHSPEGSEISVTLTPGRKCCLTVTNDGTIAAEELERIFDRYYRTDASRSKETGGYGLGLAIARAAVNRHSGNISASSENGRTSFTVTLPCVKK